MMLDAVVTDAVATVQFSIKKTQLFLQLAKQTAFIVDSGLEGSGKSAKRPFKKKRSHSTWFFIAIRKVISSCSRLSNSGQETFVVLQEYVYDLNSSVVRLYMGKVKYDIIQKSTVYENIQFF